ncbi:hypothetical protein BDW74DRAFT_67403 [Aspergillus multicolor]|uniref:uncharacterized protein n=1 Tax=Aspergillus multicolor TaxID=41759 RepID=UPI003CCD8094
MEYSPGVGIVGRVISDTVGIVANRLETSTTAVITIITSTTTIVLSIEKKSPLLHNSISLHVQHPPGERRPCLSLDNPILTRNSISSSIIGPLPGLHGCRSIPRPRLPATGQKFRGRVSVSAVQRMGEGRGFRFSRGLFRGSTGQAGRSSAFSWPSLGF